MAKQSELSMSDGAGVPVLVTRPAPQAAAFASALVTRFGARVRPVLSPLVEPQYLAPPRPDDCFDAVVFTSQHGVEAARRLGWPLPDRAYCVGRATAVAATSAGFVATSADGDVTDLVSLIEKEKTCHSLLYLHGVDTIGNLDKQLIFKGFHVLSLQVYLQAPIPFPRESTQILERPRPVLAPLFSPRSARLFRDVLPENLRADLRLAALSDAVAAQARMIPHSALAIARHPNAAAMLDAVESLLVDLPLP